MFEKYEDYEYTSAEIQNQFKLNTLKLLYKTVRKMLYSKYADRANNLLAGKKSKCVPRDRLDLIHVVLQ